MRSSGTAGGGSGCEALRSPAIVAILLSALAASLRAAAAVPDLTSRRSQSVQVVVRAVDRAGAALVERLAGRVVRPLPIIRGFAARLPAAHLRALKRSPLVASATGDVRVSLAGAVRAAGAEGTSPLGVIADQIGVAELWARGLTGAGVEGVGFRPS
jgi:hypothetical protein